MMQLKWVDGGIGPAPLSLPPLPFTWELPPKTLHEVPIDGTTYVNGVPVRLRYVMVKDSPREIGRHFLESFKKQGLFISPGQNVDRMLTGVDPQSIYTYTVVLQPNGPDHTTVILGEAMPLEKKAQTTSGLPLPPSAKNVLPVAFEGYTVVAFTVPDAVADLQKFYATELPRRGYRPKSESIWVKGGEELDVKLTAAKNGSQVVIEQRATRD